MACAVCRADHIGSLLRPRVIKDAYKAHEAGTLDDAGFAAVQDKAISDVVAMQEAAGFDAVTDGEFRRQSWFAAFVEAVDGLIHKDTYFNFTDDAHSDVPTRVLHVEGPIRRTQVSLRLNTISSRPWRTRLPGYNAVAERLPLLPLPGRHRPRVYPDEDTFWRTRGGLSARSPARERGRTYVQIDEAPMALLCDAKVRERVAGRRGTPRAARHLYPA